MDAIKAEIAVKRKALEVPATDGARPTKYLRRGEVERLKEEQERKEREVEAQIRHRHFEELQREKERQERKKKEQGAREREEEQREQEREERQVALVPADMLRLVCRARKQT